MRVATTSVKLKNKRRKKLTALYMYETSKQIVTKTVKNEAINVTNRNVIAGVNGRLSEVKIQTRPRLNVPLFFDQSVYVSCILLFALCL